MKTYKDFLTEKKAFSPQGEAAREKMRAQNELNRKKKSALVPAEKGSALVKYKKSKEEEREEAKREARQKLASGSAGKPQLKGKQLALDKRKTELMKKREEEDKKKADDEKNKKRSELLGKVKSGLVGTAQALNPRTGGEAPTYEAKPIA